VLYLCHINSGRSSCVVCSMFDCLMTVLCSDSVDSRRRDDVTSTVLAATTEV